MSVKHDKANAAMAKTWKSSDILFNVGSLKVKSKK